MSTLTHRVRLPVALVLVSALTTAAWAQNYPDKPVTLVVPYGSGAADYSARILSAFAPDLIGQPMVVVNKAGAGGIIGSASVVNAKPDGYTLLLARIGSQALNPALQPKTTPYKWDQFTMLGMLDQSPYVCVVKTDSEFKTLAQLISAIKASPGKINYSTAGPGTIQALGPQMLLDLAGIDDKAAVAIPYKGGSEAATAVLGGQVQFGCNNLSSVLGNIQGGLLRALMVTTEKRIDELPGVSTVAELGFKKLETLTGWSALFGPPNLPAEVVTKWTTVLTKVGADVKWKEATVKAGASPNVLAPAATRAFVKEQFETYEKLGKKLGIVMD